MTVVSNRRFGEILTQPHTTRRDSADDGANRRPAVKTQRSPRGAPRHHRGTSKEEDGRRKCRSRGEDSTGEACSLGDERA